MKKLVLFAAFMVLFGTISSQEQIKTDTSFIINNNKIQIIDSSKGLKIKVYKVTDDGYTPINPYYEGRYERSSYISEDINYSSKNSQNVTIKVPLVPTNILNESDVIVLEKSLDNYAKELEDNVKKTKKTYKINTFYANYPSIYYAYSQMYDNPWNLASKSISQRPISFEWGSYLFSTAMCYNKSRTLGLTAAIGFSNTYNYLNNKMVLASDNGIPYVYDFDNSGEIIPSEFNDRSSVDKSFIRYWSVRLPISVQIQWRLGYNKMALSAGPEFEWRFAMRSFARYDGSKHTLSKDLNYNPLGINALVALSYDDVVIFGRMGLTSMFASELNTFQFNIGLGFNL